MKRALQIAQILQHGMAAHRQGELAEAGTHDELLARGGLYAELYRAQFDKPVPESPTGVASLI